MTIDFYGAQGWSTRTQAEPLDRERRSLDLLLRVLRNAPAGRALDVLDVGCGDGTFLAHLDRRVQRELPDLKARFVGAEYSVHQLEAAAQLPYEFHQCDLNVGLPLPGESIDIIYAGELIEHLQDPDLLIEECGRVLRPRGWLLLTTPNPHAWYNRVLFAAGVQPLFFETSTRSTEVGAGPLRRLKKDSRPVGHLRLFNRTALSDLLRREGFERRVVTGAGFHALPGPVAWVDRAMNAWPTMASNLVVLARKPRPS